MTTLADTLYNLRDHVNTQNTQLPANQQISTADDHGRWDDGSRRVDWCPPVPDASPGGG